MMTSLLALGDIVYECSRAIFIMKAYTVVTPLGVKHALTFQSMIISIAYMFIIPCNIS
jgi:hypothetical protein